MTHLVTSEHCKTTLPVKLVIIGKKQKNHGAGLGKEIMRDSALKGLTPSARERLVFPSVDNQTYSNRGSQTVPFQFEPSSRVQPCVKTMIA